MELTLHCRDHAHVVEGLRPCGRCGQTFCRDCLVYIQGHPYCASCKAEKLLDVRSGISGDKAFELASIGKRFLALVVDSFIIGIPLAAIAFSAMLDLMTTGKLRPEEVVFLPLVFWMGLVITVCYEGLMLGARGQTLGKMALGIKVVRADGNKLTKGQAWGRALMRQVLIGCLRVVNYLPAFFTPERTTLHDMVAGTRVINWR